MNNPDLNEILNKEISDLVDLMHHAIKVIGKQYDLNSNQLSDIERDFIARLAFVAIRYGDKKEEEEDCESCPAKDHCSFKESEKSSECLPDYVVNALIFIKNYCKGHDCKCCPFASVNGIFCHLGDKPSDWEV